METPSVVVHFPGALGKLRLEVEAEESLGKCTTPGDFLSSSLFRYIEGCDLQNVISELFQLSLERLLLLIDGLNIDANDAVNNFILHIQELSVKNVPIDPALGKNRAAVYSRLLNAARAATRAVECSIDGKVGLAHGIILCGVIEVYGGSQVFYKKRSKSKREVASLGGMARAEIYKPTKEKICALLAEREPKDGWANLAEAHTSILPEIKEYLLENNIRTPSVFSMDSTLMNWLKKDPLVSKAVRIFC